MAHYLITSTFKPADGNKEQADNLLQRAEAVARERRSKVPNLKIAQSYALKHSFQTIDIVEAEQASDVDKFAEIIRTLGKVEANVTPLRTWKELTASRKAKKPV